MDIIPIIILSIVGFVCALSIHLVNKYLPKEQEHLKKAQEVSEVLPGINCGACGFAGCFAYAQAIAKDKETLFESPCMALMKDEDSLKKLEEKLGCKIGKVDLSKVAIIHCNGNPEIIYEYEGIQTCKAAAQLAAGYKKCPFSCMGIGDCVTVCPNDALSIDKEKNIAVVNRDNCIGCGLCVDECPFNLIEIVSAKLPQYLGCSYSSKFNIYGRDRCSTGCIHCKICLKVSPEALDWDEKKDIPRFVEKSIPAQESIIKCPKKIILPLALDMEIEEKTQEQ